MQLSRIKRRKANIACKRVASYQATTKFASGRNRQCDVLNVVEVGSTDTEHETNVGRIVGL